MNSEKIKKNVSLKNHTTFKIGGKARYFLEANNRDEIIGAIKWANENGLPFFVLGQGSNVLISDKKCKGLVIKINFTGVILNEVKDDERDPSPWAQNDKIIKVDAGVSLAKVVGLAFQDGLTGMEWAMGIPGTIGGAVYGNAGAFGKSISDVVEEVEAIDIENKELRIMNYDNKECEFGYRESVFKKNKNLIILSVKIKLEKGDKTEIEKQMKENWQIKKQKQPLEYYSAGSVFKNPDGYFAAKLIEDCGLKGKQIGQAQVSNKHSNFIVNMGNARDKDVKKLIDLIKKQVKKKFNITLQEEIQYLNF